MAEKGRASPEPASLHISTEADPTSSTPRAALSPSDPNLGDGSDTRQRPRSATTAKQMGTISSSDNLPQYYSPTKAERAPSPLHRDFKPSDLQESREPDRAPDRRASSIRGRNGPPGGKLKTAFVVFLAALSIVIYPVTIELLDDTMQWAAPVNLLQRCDKLMLGKFAYERYNSYTTTAFTFATGASILAHYWLSEKRKGPWAVKAMPYLFMFNGYYMAYGSLFYHSVWQWTQHDSTSMAFYSSLVLAWSLRKDKFPGGSKGSENNIAVNFWAYLGWLYGIQLTWKIGTIYPSKYDIFSAIGNLIFILFAYMREFRHLFQVYTAHTRDPMKHKSSSPILNLFLMISFALALCALGTLVVENLIYTTAVCHGTLLHAVWHTLSAASCLFFTLYYFFEDRYSYSPEVREIHRSDTVETLVV